MNFRESCGGFVSGARERSLAPKLKQRERGEEGFKELESKGLSTTTRIGARESEREGAEGIILELAGGSYSTG